MKRVFLFGNLRRWFTKIIVLLSFHLVSRKNSQNRNENVFINILWHITFYTNIGISNWHNCSFDPTNMKVFTLFQFLTWFLTSKYLKLFSTYLVGWNGALWNTYFLAPQKAKKENQPKHKNQLINRLFIGSSSRMKDYICHYEVRQLRSNVYINSKKIIWTWKFFVYT